jgi:type VI secretion system protein ImpC
MAVEKQTESAAPAVAVDEVEDFREVLKKKFRTRNDTVAEDQIAKAVQTLATAALSDEKVIKNEVLDTIEGMIAKIDQKLSDQVNAILHAPEFQKLESAWRGLNYLVFNSETDASLKIRVLNVGKEELYRNLKLYPGARWDQSPLFKAVYESEFGTLGGDPYGALIADYEFSHKATDVQLLRDLSKISASAMAPLVANGHPNLMRMDSWTELMDPRDLSKVMDTPEYAAWRGLRDSEDAKYVALTLPRVLSRRPYGAKSEPIEEFAFEEETSAHASDNYAWMGAAYAMGVNINRAFKEYGWTVQIRGVDSGGIVENLPTHEFPSDDGDIDQKCPTEIAITDRREGELSKAGLLALCHRKNTDKAAFIGGQSLYKPKTFIDDAATASDDMASKLPYMFAVSRFAHYLKCMVRDKIGSLREKPELERWLNAWITTYVAGDPRNASEEQKAKRPLAAARVTVIPDELHPGQYAANVYLRPHFQLEGMDIGMSLVAALPPEPKS